MKHTTLLLAALLAAVAATAQPQPPRPTVAVVLSGGGAKGVAHIAALRAVEEAGIPIDIICGTSMGSLIGALYCIGYSTDYLDSLVRSQDWAYLLSDRADPSGLTLKQREEQNTYALIRGLSSNRPDMGGLIRGRNLDRLFRQLCHAYPDSISFDSLPIRFACVATDIVGNTEVDFHSGHLITAMRASMAIPGVFTPVRIGDSVLVDGGLHNNFPVDLARQMGADIIIGATVQDAPLTASDIRDAATVFSQIIDNNTKNKFEENAAACDVLMRVDVSGYSAASFTTAAIDTLLRRGAEEAARHSDDLAAIATRIKGGQHPSTRRASPSAAIGYVPSQTKGVQPASAATDRHASPTGRVGEKPVASIGFRFDSEDMGALKLNIKSPLPTRLPLGASATLRLGRRLEAGAELTLLPRGFTSPTAGYTYSHHELDINTFGVRTYNTKYRQHTADLSPLNFRFRNFTFNAGLRWDYFDFYGRLLSADSLFFTLADAHYLSYHLSADLNTEDHWYFPTRGTRLHLAYAYRTDNLLTLGDRLGINEIALHWRLTLSPIPRLSLQPMIYTRLLLSDNVPLVFSNAIGGQWFGHFVEQQMPFPGVNGVEYADALFGAVRLQAQVRILKNHYALLAAAAALDDDSFATLFSQPPTLGLQAGYSYHTPLGPIDLRIGYSNLTDKVCLFINLGHWF